jgi:relaxase-like protein
MNTMAIVRVTSFTRSRGAAKATIRYITHRPGNDGLRKTRQISAIDGEVNKDEAYRMIDEAKKGSVFFRFVISPDPQTEDIRQDLYLQQITTSTLLTLEDRLRKEIPFIAVEHTDHTPHRHVHVLACVHGRVNPEDLKALRDRATEATLLQRQERDLANQHKARLVEEAQWEL